MIYHSLHLQKYLQMIRINEYNCISNISCHQNYLCYINY